MSIQTPQLIRCFDSSVPEERFYFAVTMATLNVFPDTLRKSVPFDYQTLAEAFHAKRLSREALLAAAYFGFMPLPSTYPRFIAQSDKHFTEQRRVGESKKRNPSASLSRRKIVEAEENEAASTWGVTRDELKLLYKELNRAAAGKGYSSFPAIYHCGEDVLREGMVVGTLERPSDRYAYALGPRFLWDLAKAAARAPTLDVAFAVHLDWVLFLSVSDGIARGYALQPRAHRFGDYFPNNLINRRVLADRNPDDTPIFDVPIDVQSAIREFAADRFPDAGFELIPPPTIGHINFLAEAEVQS